MKEEVKDLEVEALVEEVEDLVDQGECFRYKNKKSQLFSCDFFLRYSFVMVYAIYLYIGIEILPNT